MHQANFKSISVGLGELQVSCDPKTVLVAHGLGSCVGICGYDPVVKVAGLLHAMLPEMDGRGRGRPTRYVNTGIMEMLEKMHTLGAVRRRCLFRVVGGAQMLNAPGLNSTLNIGARNAEAARAVIQREKLKLAGADTGGTWGRTVKLYVDSGSLTVRSVGRGERELPLS